MFINKKFYIKSWLLRVNSQFILKENYLGINLLENKGIFIRFELVLFFCSKLKVILKSLKKNNCSILFVATRSTYLKSVCKNSLWYLIGSRYAGVFSNFAIVSLKAFENINLLFLPSCLIFFHNRSKDQFILEAVKSMIPCIGLFSILRNSILFAYSLSINSDFFINTVFLIKYFLKLW